MRFRVVSRNKPPKFYRKFELLTILNDCSSSCLARSSNSDRDFISSSNSDIAEIIRVIRIPLVPSIVRVAGTRFGPVDTSLQNGSITGVAVNADPSGSGSGS